MRKELSVIFALLLLLGLTNAFRIHFDSDAFSHGHNHGNSSSHGHDHEGHGHSQDNRNEDRPETFLSHIFDEEESRHHGPHFGSRKANNGGLKSFFASFVEPHHREPTNHGENGEHEHHGRFQS